MDLLTPLVFWLGTGAVMLVALFYVVRAAVVSALRAHHAELNTPAGAQSHLDADGL